MRMGNVLKSFRQRPLVDLQRKCFPWSKMRFDFIAEKQRGNRSDKSDKKNKLLQNLSVILERGHQKLNITTQLFHRSSTRWIEGFE